ncbi:MAG: DUF1572 family protein [Saprospiraceae bacterium]|nr:DUF1572 family protein [Saprospiraceae bacterium]
MNISDLYLKSVKQRFLQYKSLGEKAMAQIDDDQLNIQLNEESNSISTIIKHLHGNMMSRWTDFLTSDGEKPWRERDGEFENDLTDRVILMERWEEGWTCLFTTLDKLGPDDLTSTVYIRNQEHTVLDAIQRQLAHYAYHVGQIVFLSKALSRHRWQSLSIPKGQSKSFIP